MNIDLEYLKELLVKFESSPKAYTNILELKKQGLDYESETFIFHLHLLWDKGIIATENKNSNDFGLSRTSNGAPVWGIVNLRLTFIGHDFIEALKNDNIWAKLKSDFQKSSMTTILDVSKTLLGEYLKKKMGLI